MESCQSFPNTLRISFLLAQLFFMHGHSEAAEGSEPRPMSPCLMIPRLGQMLRGACLSASKGLSMTTLRDIPICGKMFPL